jgi:hypothetical protein
MHDEHLKDFVGRFAQTSDRESDSGEADAGLPEPSGTYKAYARATTQPVYTLHCLLGAAGMRSFQYVHLDSDTRFDVDRRGQIILLKFLGSKTTTVLIKGRNLRELYDYIHQHRMPWVMELENGRDFGSGDEPVVTKIEFADEDESQRRPEPVPAKVLEMG